MKIIAQEQRVLHLRIVVPSGTTKYFGWTDVDLDLNMTDLSMSAKTSGGHTFAHKWDKSEVNNGFIQFCSDKFLDIPYMLAAMSNRVVFDQKASKEKFIGAYKDNAKVMDKIQQYTGASISDWLHFLEIELLKEGVNIENSDEFFVYDYPQVSYAFCEILHSVAPRLKSLFYKACSQSWY